MQVACGPRSADPTSKYGPFKEIAANKYPVELEADARCRRCRRKATQKDQRLFRRRLPASVFASPTGSSGGFRTRSRSPSPQWLSSSWPLLRLAAGCANGAVVRRRILGPGRVHDADVDDCGHRLRRRHITADLRSHTQAGGVSDQWQDRSGLRRPLLHAGLARVVELQPHLQRSAGPRSHAPRARARTTVP